MYFNGRVLKFNVFCSQWYFIAAAWTKVTVFLFFLKIFCLDQGPFCGATDCSCFGLCMSFLMGFKSRVDILPALFLACMPALFLAFCDPEGHIWCDTCLFYHGVLKVTSGATPAFSTNRGVHCISMYTAWRPVTFPTCHICNRGRLPGFDRETSRTVSRRALHSATATGSYS